MSLPCDRLVVGFLSLVTALTLLGAADLAAQQIRYGPESPLGEGTARTYLAVDPDGRPSELGFALSETAMATLPDLADKPDHEAFVVVDLELPEGSPAQFRFASMDWNPRGHIPPGIYTVPHFDFHFYTVDPATRDAIMPGESDAPGETGDFAGTAFEQRGMMTPEAGWLPAHYVNPGGTTVPMMGGHWIDPGSHEFHGEPFDKTFIYGTWDGQVIFWEPMITKAFIESKPESPYQIAAPEKVPQPGWYPSSYLVRYDANAKEYRIALTGFAERS